MTPEEYRRVYGAGLPDIPTPVIDRKTGEWRPLSAILYAPPPPESGRAVKRRMAEQIIRQVSAAGAVTREDLRAGFSEEQIDRYFKRALHLAGAHRLGATL